MMGIEEKRRVLFEAWWQAHKGGGEAPIRYRGQYVSDSAIWAWIGFNAALDAVLIELPEKFDGDHGGEAHEAEIHDSAIDECRTAIDGTGLGLRVKP